MKFGITRCFSSRYSRRGGAIEANINGLVVTISVISDDVKQAVFPLHLVKLRKISLNHFSVYRNSILVFNSQEELVTVLYHTAICMGTVHAL